ncbi:MAG: hypothetical protein WD431_00170 [Cyclobacteriaceae bacterium]
MNENNNAVPVSNKPLRNTHTGIIVSAVLAVIKGLGGVFGNSYALIADAKESGADVFTSTLLIKDIPQVTDIHIHVEPSMKRILK